MAKILFFAAKNADDVATEQSQGMLTAGLKMPPGVERERLLKRANHMETDLPEPDLPTEANLPLDPGREAETDSAGSAHQSRQTKRATKLAAAAIDKHVDTDASVEDQERRKQRLLQGPEEFRAARTDRDV